MRLCALIVVALALAAPALAQDEPEITPEETAAATAAVEAANLSGSVYRDLWCAGLYSHQYSSQVAAAEPGAAQRAADARNDLYRKAAVDLLAAGLSEMEFTGLAESVHTVVLSQVRAGVTATDFTDQACETARLP